LTNLHPLPCCNSEAVKYATRSPARVRASGPDFDEELFRVMGMADGVSRPALAAAGLATKIRASGSTWNRLTAARQS
jgi:hypothetical protein